MTRSLTVGMRAILIIALLAGMGCRPDIPLDLNSLDPSRDQSFIADQYLRQAAIMKQKAEDLKINSERYAQLFGPDSEWATSAKLLEQFYEKEAKNRERLAARHSELGKSNPHSTHLETR